MLELQVLSEEEVAAERTKPVYSYADVQAVAVWQDEGPGYKGRNCRALLRAVAKMPRAVRASTAPVYRLLRLPHKLAEQFLKTGKLKSTPAESWTTSLAVIRRFRAENYHLAEGVAPDSDSVDVLLAMTPRRSEVLLDLAALYKDRDWLASVKYWQEAAYESNKWVGEGVEFKGTQREIVIGRNAFLLKDVHGVLTLDGKLRKGPVDLVLRREIESRKALDPYGD